MRVLVTGGAGFIGSHLCDRLVEIGCQVTIVDDLSLGRRSNIAHLLNASRVEFVEMNILAAEFDAVVEQGQFDAVFHLAANSDIQAGSSDRRVDLERTLLTTWHVLENMARCKIRQLVFASTSAVYGNVAEPTGENYGPLIPVSFYGASKLASEAYLSAYAHRQDIRTWVFRFPNVVGSRATHGVILDFVRKLRKNPKALEVLGNGTQEKPYLYVQELLDAILLAWRQVNPNPYEVFNIGPESSTRVSTIAELVVRKMGLDGIAAIRYGDEPIGWPGDVSRFSYHLQKIYDVGWKACSSSNEAVSKAVADVIAEQGGV